MSQNGNRFLIQKCSQNSENLFNQEEKGKYILKNTNKFEIINVKDRVHIEQMADVISPCTLFLSKCLASRWCCSLFREAKIITFYSVQCLQVIFLKSWAYKIINVPLISLFIFRQTAVFKLLCYCLMNDIWNCSFWSAMSSEIRCFTLQSLTL